MPAWLGVACAEHVARGVRMGIAQTNHGKRAGVARMQPGDWLVYYSPTRRLGEPSPVRAFTAVGQIADDRLWQADEGSFRPWRRAVRYRLDAREVPVRALHGRLDLTAAPNWGYALRRGLLPLTDHDLATILEAATGESLAAAPQAGAEAWNGQPSLW